jgi:hypothetical protein
MKVSCTRLVGGGAVVFGLSVLAVGVCLPAVSPTASSAAPVPAGVSHHPQCNNDPGFDPSNDPNCRWQHARFGDWGYRHHDTVAVPASNRATIA